MKRIVSLLLTAACVLGCCALGASAAPSPGFVNFRRTESYSDGMFRDVPEDSPYRDSVAAVYELGLMRGGADGNFGAEELLTAAETLVLACKLHSLYHTGTAEFASTDPWYQVYVDYAAQNGIYSGTWDDYAVTVMRSDFAAVLAHALPAAALPAINDVPYGKLADVGAFSALPAQEIYTLYRAGVFSGAGDTRTYFRPTDTLTHAEAAQAVSRMAYRSLRQKFSLPDWPWPDVSEQTRADDAFFSDSAMLGASLVQGMSLYSGLKDVMDFYCDQGQGISGAEFWAGELCKSRYDRVYIEYGADDLYMLPEDFAAGIVERIRDAMPEAEIYVMAVTPVTKERSESGEFPMARIREFNDALYSMCEGKKCWFLNTCTPLCDETGYLVPDYAGWDGSPHLSDAGYAAWEETVRTYYVI